MHNVLHTMRGLGRRVALLAALPAALLLSAGAAAQSWSAATTPANGHIGGRAGSALSWGYEIANLDAALWLVTTGVSADTFQYATPTSMFRFPILGPGQADSMPASGAFGLYGLTWHANAPLGYVNQGSFLLTAEWWSGDPLAGGSYVSAADSMWLDYSATVTSLLPVPEPSAAPLLLAGLALLGWRHRSRKCTAPARR
ncbi:hypothetical protein ASD15_14560 [Massilia sp. Root351]|uniref:PEP-CTERM sorting domain-containing protein n=1 Tax=Massilia sp. Root351 TaxID=1736522 RepID=UPI00070B8668|nr:PEP-CTERM sorting domain-containing protein [Massilia sp. Root351]KQV80099.1 hypothetical protein ASD15_14560 [Massilia sp. Root351]